MICLRSLFQHLQHVSVCAFEDILVLSPCAVAEHSESELQSRRLFCVLELARSETAFEITDRFSSSTITRDESLHDCDQLLQFE
jgi:hypothetical protein